ncbi:MAG TPA: hypothetical protein VIN61_06855 [Gammaproteobacteria bacterium]
MLDVHVIALVAISFFSFVTGTVMRKWPEKVQEHAGNIDPLLSLLSPRVHRAMIEVCGVALVTLSMVALLAIALI